jgi:hypothetical protein
MTRLEILPVDRATVKATGRIAPYECAAATVDSCVVVKSTFFAGNA